VAAAHLRPGYGLLTFQVDGEAELIRIFDIGWIG
jgi:hypothetical protein